ncbi:hypothetical protein [Variovorax boronicumulans]|uniref:hypothetical protein n=1 Tax=Variovorax boronicumulans TaxID=436515 RepID=UPI001C55C222
MDVSPGHNVARLAGTLVFMDAGPGSATIELYGVEFAPGEDPGEQPLVTLLLAKPSATLTDVLTLHQGDITGDLILHSGIVKTARFKSATGAWVMDTDAGEEGGDAAVQLPTTVLRAGGRCPLSLSVIG